MNRKKSQFFFIAASPVQLSFWLFALLFIFMAWYFLLGPSDENPGSFFNTGENAIWLEHEWVDQPKSVSEISALVNRLGQSRIQYVYVHVGPIEENGGVSPQRYLYARDFLQTARAYGDRIQYLAWLGQLRGKIAFQDSQIRLNIAETARKFVQEIGFDGVHYDIEPLFDSDIDFLFLLEETREKIGDERLISVALREMVPYFTGRILSWFLKLDTFNHPLFYQKITDRADQIVIMTYENSIKKPALYRYFVKNELIWLTRILSGTGGGDGADRVNSAGGRSGAGGAGGAKIFIGLPTYDQPSLTFYPEAENIENGLLGLISGLNNWRSVRERFAGVALYRYSTTDEKEWKTYQNLWNGNL